VFHIVDGRIRFRFFVLGFEFAVFGFRSSFVVLLEHEKRRTKNLKLKPTTQNVKP